MKHKSQIFRQMYHISRTKFIGESCKKLILIYNCLSNICLLLLIYIRYFYQLLQQTKLILCRRKLAIFINYLGWEKTKLNTECVQSLRSFLNFESEDELWLSRTLHSTYIQCTIASVCKYREKEDFESIVYLSLKLGGVRTYDDMPVHCAKLSCPPLQKSSFTANTT